MLRPEFIARDGCNRSHLCDDVTALVFSLIFIGNIEPWRGTIIRSLGRRRAKYFQCNHARYCKESLLEKQLRRNCFQRRIQRESLWNVYRVYLERKGGTEGDVRYLAIIWLSIPSSTPSRKSLMTCTEEDFTRKSPMRYSSLFKERILRRNVNESGLGQELGHALNN